MKLTCKRETFSQLFSLAATVASIKDIKAVLQNVKMNAAAGRVILTATDMEIAIRLEMESAEIAEEGETILPTRLMRKILQESCDDSITMESVENRIIISGERSFYQIPTQSAEDFPEVPPFSSEVYHEIAGNVVQEHIRRTLFAIDTENTKYTLGGVLFELTESRIAAVATDGRRLANQEGTAVSAGGHFSENSAIVPLKALALIDKAIGSSDENVKIFVSGGKIIFAGKNVVISSRLIEGRFPRWKNIMPNKDDRVKVDLMVGPFLQGVRQAEVVTTDNQPGIILDFTTGKLELSASGSEVGDSRIELPIVYDGENIKLKMDPRFLIDFLRVLGNEMIVSVFIKDQQSVLFETNDGYSYVVMPLT